VKDDPVWKRGNELHVAHFNLGWTSFFALEIDVPKDFLAERDDSPPQSRELPWLLA